MTVAPWAEKNRLVRIGVRGKEVTLEEKKGANLVFLIDTSGSMNTANKLPLLRQSLELLLPKLGENDRVSIVTYAGSAGLVLAPTRGDEREAIRQALGRLEAGGSTNGGSGIALAYDVAKRQFIRDGVNRVILCTDGDFNVGVTNPDALVDMVSAKAKTGVFLSVLGFGMGNLKDATLERIADKGDGNYAYIDTLEEGRKVLAEGLGTLVTIAKDVKVQVSFDLEHVQSYRLIGYENRVMANKDFADDTKDAGELGSGHTVTALYEVVPKTDGDTADFLKVELRYKEAEGGASKLVAAAIGGDDSSANPSTDLRFAAGVAAFGMLLRDSPHKGTADWAMVERLVQAGLVNDETGRRKELLALVKQAAALGSKR
jgi:Ca-activated chloride channel family protein